tara:strand:- start:179793 stop:180173 length:381 start_codon:yes stop_codon:yes gene_type:complete
MFHRMQSANAVLNLVGLALGRSRLSRPQNDSAVANLMMCDKLDMIINYDDGIEQRTTTYYKALVRLIERLQDHSTQHVHYRMRLDAGDADTEHLASMKAELDQELDHIRTMYKSLRENHTRLTNTL